MTKNEINRYIYRCNGSLLGDRATVLKPSRSFYRQLKFVFKHTKKLVYSLLERAYTYIRARVRALAGMCARAGKHSFTGLSFAMFLFVVSGASIVAGAGISQGFISGEDLAKGALVSIDQSNPGKVILANSDNAEYLVGVATEIEDSLLTLKSADSNVQVATSGQVFALVTNENGDIVAGDILAPSNISGVAVKTSEDYLGKALGVAKSDFNAFSEAQIANANGKDIRVGRIMVELILGGVVIGKNTETDQAFLTELGSTLVDKEVTTLQVVFAIGLFLISLGVGAMLLLNSSRTSFTSLGRNPLSSTSITSNLLHVTTISVAVLIIGLVASYGVLLL